MASVSLTPIRKARDFTHTIAYLYPAKRDPNEVVVSWVAVNNRFAGALAAYRHTEQSGNGFLTAEALL